MREEREREREREREDYRQTRDFRIQNGNAATFTHLALRHA